MKVGEMFPSKYLNATDLGGRTYILTIRCVREEKVRRQGGKEETAYVVYFQNAQKGLILCKTSAHQIAEVCGNEDTDTWTGMKVALFAEETTVAGQKRMAIRARRVGVMAQGTPPVGVQAATPAATAVGPIGPMGPMGVQATGADQRSALPGAIPGTSPA
jgi:hypothetical protein